MEKYCGVDVHKKRFNAAIVREDCVIGRSEFKNDFMGATEFVSWLRSNGCNRVAMESTGPYWMGLYDLLKVSKIETVVANPAYTKAIAGKKTDKVDARWLAMLYQARLIEPSYIPNEYFRKLRRLTRMREKLVRVRSSIKNAAHGMVDTFSAEYPTLMQMAEKLQMVDLLPKVMEWGELCRDRAGR